MDKRDIALQRSCPSTSIPRFGELERRTVNGERVLVGSNGTFLEVTRSWGYFIRRIAAFEAPVTLPYGEGAAFQQLAMEKLPRDLFEQFNEHARKNSHIEVGAAILWNERTGTCRLALSESLEAGPGHLKYKLADLDEGEHLLVDCHSHARFPAGFSAQDNADDQHNVKFAYVVGNCDLATPSYALRLCLKGIYEMLPISFN